MNGRPSLSVGQGSRGLSWPSVPWITVLWVAIASGLWGLLGPAPDALVFDRAAIADGEGWRLLTGHLVHSDGHHALWDIGALAIIGCLLESHGRRRLLLVAGSGLLAVDAWLWWGMPDLARYCGLSGILNALFVVVLADLWRRDRDPLVALVAAVLVLKLVAELLVGQSLLLATQWPSVPSSHLAGGLGGLLFVGVGRLPVRYRADHPSGEPGARSCLWPPADL